MADETTHPEGDASPAPKKAGGTNMLMMIAVPLVTLVLGVASGSFVVAPRIIDGKTASKNAESLENDEGAGGGGHGVEETGNMFAVENVIVNPAGSRGSRFLMIDVVFELPDKKYEAQFRRRDVQVRDIVISTLERWSLDELSAPDARDNLRVALAAAVQVLIPSNAGPIKTYLPRFVIQ